MADSLYDDSHGFCFSFISFRPQSSTFLRHAQIPRLPRAPFRPFRSFHPFLLFSSRPPSLPPFLPTILSPFPLLPSRPPSLPPFLPTILSPFPLLPSRPPSFPPFLPTILSPFPLLSSRPPPFPPFLPTCFFCGLSATGEWRVLLASAGLPVRRQSAYAAELAVIAATRLSCSDSPRIPAAPFGSAGPALCPAGHARVCSSLTLGTHPTGHPRKVAPRHFLSPIAAMGLTPTLCRSLYLPFLHLHLHLLPSPSPFTLLSSPFSLLPSTEPLLLGIGFYHSREE